MFQRFTSIKGRLLTPHLRSVLVHKTPRAHSLFKVQLKVGSKKLFFSPLTNETLQKLLRDHYVEMSAKLEEAKESFDSWRTKARAMLEEKDRELDHVKSRKAGGPGGVLLLLLLLLLLLIPPRSHTIHPPPTHSYEPPFTLHYEPPFTPHCCLFVLAFKRYATNV